MQEFPNFGIAITAITAVERIVIVGYTKLTVNVSLPMLIKLLLFHQPGEVFAMTTVGEVPPETLRIDFYCTGAAMDRFRGTTLHAEPTEQHDLDWLANTANTVFDAAPVRGEPPIVKEDLPFGAMQQFIIHLENLLILLARRCRRTKRPVARVRRERRQYVLVEDARAYFAANLTRELKVDEVCAALGCTRPQLQQAFRARLRRTAMEEFSAMRIEYADIRRFILKSREVWLLQLPDFTLQMRFSRILMVCMVIPSTIST